LSWTDRFYDDKPHEIVAVFDMDFNGILNDHVSNALTLSLHAFWMLLVSIFFWELNIPLLTVGFMILCSACSIFGMKAWYRVQAVHSSIDGGGMHMAITTTSVRYDQLDPEASIEVSRLHLSAPVAFSAPYRPAYSAIVGKDCLERYCIMFFKKSGELALLWSCFYRFHCNVRDQRMQEG
jgi:hypothetical protein